VGPPASQVESGFGSPRWSFEVWGANRRGQGFESQKLHSLFSLVRHEAHPCHFSNLFGPHWTGETRNPKHEPRTLTEERTAWHTQAAETLGGPEAVQAMITHALNPSSAPSPAVDADWVAATAEKVLAAVEERRSTWQAWHVRAEAHRHIRGAQVPTDKVDQLVELLVTDVLQTRSTSLTRTDDGISERGRCVGRTVRVCRHPLPGHRRPVHCRPRRQHPAGRR
jgi:hypothetical protein